MTSMTKRSVSGVVSQITRKNKGTGAGGAGTNRSGKTFENDYDICTHFKMKKTIIKRNKCLTPVEFYEFEDENMPIVLKQNKFPAYLQHYHGIKKGSANYYLPDTCFINNKTEIIHILEMKNQQDKGTVDTKILAGANFKKLYQNYVKDYGLNHTVLYGFSLSSWFRKEKYKDWLRLLDEDCIPYFFVDDTDYYNKIKIWVK